MHDCQKFREDWIGGSAEEAPWCGDCRQFCDEAIAVLAVLHASADIVPDVPEPYWAGFDNRLRARIIGEKFAARRRVSQRWLAAFGAVASLAVAVTWGTYYLPGLVVDRAELPVRIEFDANHIAGLDPEVVDFLGQSELFVRDFTKIEPSSHYDIDDARDRASRSLADITKQKKAAADFDPVRITLDEYESVLREIKNLDSPGDLGDIQMRIRRNGLVANLKAYQPRVVRVSQR